MDSVSLLLRQTSVLWIVLDRQGNFVALNPAAEKLFAHSAVALVGLPFATVLDAFSHDKASLMVTRTLAEGQLVDWELDHIQVSGAPILVGYTTTVLNDETGEVVGIGAVGHDLTSKLELTSRLASTNQELEGALLQLEKAHAALKVAQAQLVQSEKMRALGQMVAGVAHEINNPAAFIANNLAHLVRLAPALHQLYDAYAALKPLADPERLAAITAAEAAADIDYLWQDLPDLVRESQEGVERIRKIVLSLCTFSRLDEVDYKLADVNEGLRSTLQMVRSMYSNRITIREEYGELPQILCHPGELNQVFLNLLTNAVQAIEGEGSIEVKTALEGDGIAITFKDSGSGMSAGTLVRLGEPFFTTKPVGSGTGLGLAVSFGIIERRHGRIHFKSQPGQGTIAKVEVPLHDE
jgi:two-component system NtrC family sensor kinase